MKPIVRIILGIILILAVAGGSFYGGAQYGKKQAAANLTARRAGAFTGLTGQGTTAEARTNNMLFGKIKTVNADGLIVIDDSGNEITVKVAGTTLIEKNMSVKVTDLTAGETVMISGNKGSDGVITARLLQVAPAGRFNAEGGPAPIPQGSGQNPSAFSSGGRQRGDQAGGAVPAP